MSINVANDQNYRELTGQGFTIVDFYTTTCVPCRMFSRILEDLTLDFPFLNVVKVNITDYPAIGREQQIEAVPTVKFLKDGVELETSVGLLEEEEVIEKISQYYYG